MYMFLLKYTTFIAPVTFFLGGILVVIMLNKFIGHNSAEKKSE